MATLASNVLTLLDWAKRYEDGKLAKIIEMLSQNNEILEDMPFMEGNQPMGHITTLRTSLPSVTWRRMNEGVTPSKSTTAQITEACAMLEAWSEVDIELAKLSGNVNDFRLSEAAAFVEAMSQEMASTVIYGNHGVNPEEFNGFDVRYGATTGTNGQNIVQVGSTVGGGGSGSDNSSIWLVVWGEQTVHGIFSKGSKAGLEHENLGEVTVETTAGIAGSRMRAFQDKFTWKTGLALRDWRYVARIPNIDISNLSGKSGAADLFELMVRATYRIPSLANGKAAFYANRTCRQMLDIQKRDNVQLGGQLTYDDHDGKPVMKFRGIPVRLVDALTETESAIA
jgi:hypothetical protein